MTRTSLRYCRKIGRPNLRKRIEKATSHSGSELLFPKLVETSGEELRIRDAPPTIFHPDKTTAAGNLKLIRKTLPNYRETLPDDRRVLFDRYRLVDRRQSGGHRQCRDAVHDSAHDVGSRPPFVPAG